MAGRFAGILRASVPNERANDLAVALERLESSGLHVRVEHSSPAEVDRRTRCLALELVGADRPGIIRDISHALSQRGVNVEELHTECTSAPMSGELLFRARAKLYVPESSSVSELHAALEEIAADLMVDVSLDEIDELEI
jgi:glycine cleavage system regulatory protein